MIAAGGVLGAEARHGVNLLLGQSAPQFPWATLAVNTSGCALIGVLMTATAGTTANVGKRRLSRPLLGVGVIGGYTTFSAYAVEVQQLFVADRPATALAHLAATPVAALVAVWCATVLTRWAVRRSGGPRWSG